MSITRGLGDDHEVLDRNPFCSGYVDSFGKWNNGFECPKLDSERVFCCGTSTYRYCCTTTPAEESRPEYTGVQETSEIADGGDSGIGVNVGDSLPLLLGGALGAVVTITLIAVISCCFCKACLCYKKRNADKRDRMQPSSSTSAGVNNMYSYSVASLGRGEGRRRDVEDVLQEVDEVAVIRPSRTNLASGIGSLPRTFTSYRTNRVSFADSVGNSSVSTTTDNERQLFIDQSSILPPPPYNFNKLGSCEDSLPSPFQRAFGNSDLGSGHYVAGISPTDDSFYSSNKL